MNKIKLFIVLLIIGLAVVTCINPIYPNDQVLQHTGTLLLVLFLVFDAKNHHHFSAFYGVVIFTIIHIIGARYIYSTVPYNELFVDVFGFDTTAFFGSKRNHYDRFVHFAFGVLVFPAVYKWVNTWEGLSVARKILVTWLFIQGFSLIYELFEWSLTVIVSSEAATNYNGQQGDIWDAQKDMALAMLGSSLMAVFYGMKKQSSKELTS